MAFNQPLECLSQPTFLIINSPEHPKIELFSFTGRLNNQNLKSSAQKYFKSMWNSSKNLNYIPNLCFNNSMWFISVVSKNHFWRHKRSSRVLFAHTLWSKESWFFRANQWGIHLIVAEFVWNGLLTIALCSELFCASWCREKRGVKNSWGWQMHLISSSDYK